MKVEKWFTGRMAIAQTVWHGLEYSFLSAKGEQLSPFVNCKEFLMDTVWAEINETYTRTYGFVYDSETFPKVCLTETRILLRSKQDKRFEEGVGNCMSFLNQIEKGLKFTPSKAMKVVNPPGSSGYNLFVNDDEEDTRTPAVMFISGDPKWMSAPPLLSLYTMLLRLGMVYEKGSAWTFMKKVMEKKIKCYGVQDDHYLRVAFDTIKDLVQTQAERFSKDVKANWPGREKKVDSWDIHEYGGIVSLARGKCKMINPDWYPPEPELIDA